MVSRRFCEDMPWHAVFWVGLGYQLFSDFGRSMFRPALWLLAFTLLFAGSYYTLQPSPNLGAGRHACIAGPGEPVPAALQLSLRRTLLLPGIGGNGKLDEIYACLYGVDSKEPQPPGRLVPPYRVKIPDSVAVLGLAQGVLSAVLFFRLLLAVRNHFRIK